MGLNGMLRVVPVTRRHEVQAFLRLPRRVYDNLPELRWVPPLDVHVRQMMGRLDDPRTRFLLAERGGEAVARLGVRIHADRALHFGFFECLQGETEAVRLLVDEAHRLAPHLPMRGPHHFRQEDPYSGLLVDGFDRDPMFLMPYNPPHYLESLEQAGFSKCKDLLAYEFVPAQARLDLMEGRARRAVAKGITVRTLDRSRLGREVRTIASIFDDALVDNWGFEPFEEEQIRELQLLARFILNPRHVFVAQRDGVEIGTLIVLPDFNPMIKASRGRLTPGLLLQYLQRDRLVDGFRGYALGVRKSHQADEVSAALLHAMMTEGRRTKWRVLEVSWILEDNARMIAMTRALGGERTKVYRLLERPPQ